ERDALLDRGARDLLDGGQRVDHVVACGGVGEGRERVATVAGDDGGDAVRRTRSDVGIPEEVGVEVRVRVDETRREREAVPVELLVSRTGDVADHADAVTVDGDVGLEPGTSGAV